MGFRKLHSHRLSLVPLKKSEYLGIVRYYLALALVLAS